MSAEGDLLFHSDIFFPDLNDAEELDFDKSFFATDVDQSSAINGDSFDSLSGADLITPLEEDDESALFIKPLGSPGASGDFSNVQELQPHISASNAPESYTQSLVLAQTNDEFVPAFSHGHFQKPSLSLGQLKNMYPSNGGLPDMYLQGNRAGLMSPTSPGAAQKSLLSPGSTVDKLNHLSLGQQAYGGHVFDTKPAIGRGYPGSPTGVVPLSPSSKRFSPTTLSSPRAGTSHLAYGSSASQNLSSNGVVMSPPSPVGVPTSVGSLSASSPATTFDSKDSVNVLLNEKLQKAQQAKPMYMSSQGLVSRMSTAGGDSPGYLQEVDATGDGLRPLQSMSSRPPHLMQRSLSSHALGQLRTLAPVPPGGGQMSPIDPTSRMRELGSPSSRGPPQVSDMQGMNARPMMTSMRRVYSTGDIQSMQSGLDRPGGEDGAFKIGRYTLDERKMRIQRYRQKRTERNFNKKIKYACRKTLADSRPRVRGRFAKNDEVELPVKQNGRKHEEDDDEGEVMLEEDDDLFIDEDSSGDFSAVMGFDSIDLKHQDDPLSMFAPGIR
eukprot:TRINITY_DN1305_c0_g3_i1.p1 TRINITY_DN1305_c0_g3~~TRINITY_DN1305_c0_g3_i1.p1  ORF type:complete len:552 (+),score=86.96 TRINITY_DN1305_c0_g3_i1:65-1720(+)